MHTMHLAVRCEQESHSLSATRESAVVFCESVVDHHAHHASRCAM